MKVDFIDFPDISRQKIRITPDMKFSVYDFIKFCGQLGAKTVFDRCIQEKPWLQDRVEYYKFPGKGQRLTPVASGDILLEFEECFAIAMWEHKYNEEAADAFARYWSQLIDRGDIVFDPANQTSFVRQH